MSIITRPLFNYFALIFLVGSIAACAPQPTRNVNTLPDAVANAAETSRNKSIDNLNAALENQASGDGAAASVYRLGIGDKVEVQVYDAEELSKVYQVNSKGELQMPLIGGVKVGGLSVVETQLFIENKLRESILRDPQVTVNVTEYSSSEVSVLGAVRSPKIYKINQGRNPLEMLLMAGGLASNAGREMVINTSLKNPETGQLRIARLVVDVEGIVDPITETDLSNRRMVTNIVLKNGDSVYVPSAGVVYIDGAIGRPGSYDMAEDTTILSLLALAGGADWVASEKKVRVLRKIDRTTNKEYNLDLDRIRENKEENFKLESGDLILVGHNNFKYGLSVFWKYGLRFMFLL